MTEVNSIEQHIRPQRLGTAVGHILLWGVEQQARVDDMVRENAYRNPNWRVRAERGGLNLSNWILNEQARQKTKLEWRRLDTEKLRSINMIMRVRDQQGHIVSSGILQNINLRSASVVMADKSRGITRIPIAEPLLIPEEFQQGEKQQSYFGHKLIVKFEVLSIPTENVELLE